MYGERGEENATDCEPDQREGQDVAGREAFAEKEAVQIRPASKGYED